MDRVSLVAPDPVREVADELMVDCSVPAGDEFAENLVAGVAALSCDHTAMEDRLLIVMGDLPLVTSTALTDFVDRSLASPWRSRIRSSPGSRASGRSQAGGERTCGFKTGTFTGGNAVVVTRGFVDRSRDLLARLYSYRKSPLKLARLFGPGFILGLLLGRLSIEGLERRVKRHHRGSGGRDCLRVSGTRVRRR